MLRVKYTILTLFTDFLVSFSKISVVNGFFLNNLVRGFLITNTTNFDENDYEK